MLGDKGGRVRLYDDAFCMDICVCSLCMCVLVHARLHICLCLSAQIGARACLFADLSVTLHDSSLSPSRSSPRVSSETAAHSCGTRLISSVIKINEVLIAAVIHANDCVTQDEDFLSLLQSEECIWDLICT